MPMTRRAGRVTPSALTTGGSVAKAWGGGGRYYCESEKKDRAPGEPVKRMLADLALTGERRGALLFAFLRPSETAQAETDANTSVATNVKLADSR